MIKYVTSTAEGPGGRRDAEGADTFPNVQEAAAFYLCAGWQPLALRPGTKTPRAARWQERTLTVSDLATEFQDGDNIGLLCGGPSGGLVDIDIDDARARPLAHRWLPPTAMRHGRAGNPDSHWWYAVDDKETPTEQFKDPVGNAMLIELPGDGGQTIVPPSVHPSGEQLSWISSETPEMVSLSYLRGVVRQIAAATLLARHWPEEGGRNKAALALAGALLRGGMRSEDAADFIENVAEAADDEEAAERGITVSNTARKLQAGEATTGFMTLKGLFGANVADTAFKWLREAGVVEQANEWEPPVFFEQMTTPDVPASLLPDPLGAYAKALADMAEVPEALPVFAVLGAVSTAVARRFIVVPHLGWNEHVNIYTAVTLPLGNNKSLVLRCATRPRRMGGNAAARVGAEDSGSAVKAQVRGKDHRVQAEDGCARAGPQDPRQTAD